MKKQERTDNFRPRFEDSEKEEWSLVVKELRKIGVKEALRLVSGVDSSSVKSTQTFSGDNWEVSEDGTPIHTKEQLIKACKIDTSIWEIASFSVSTWNQKSKANGYSQLYSIRAKLSKKQVSSAERFFNKIKDNTYNIPACKIKTPKLSSSNNCGIINIYDAHLDKVTRATETGSFSDINNNCKLFKEMFYYLLGKSEGVNQLYFPVGNDLFNINDTRNATKRGTPQDTVLHHLDSFELILDTIVELINKAATIAPVDIPIIPGNHDTDSTNLLGMFLSKLYRNVDHVNIDYRRIPRKYRKFGKNMFLFEHGDGMKASKIPIVMAQEQSEMWANTKHRYAYLGHYHHTREHDEIGCKIRHLRAMSPKDEYHFKKGYIGIPKSAELVIASEDGSDYNLLTKSF